MLDTLTSKFNKLVQAGRNKFISKMQVLSLNWSISKPWRDDKSSKEGIQNKIREFFEKDPVAAAGYAQRFLKKNTTARHEADQARVYRIESAQGVLASSLRSYIKNNMLSEDAPQNMIRSHIKSLMALHDFAHPTKTAYGVTAEAGSLYGPEKLDDSLLVYGKKLQGMVKPPYRGTKDRAFVPA